MAAATTFQQVLDAVKAYYGSGSDQWVEIAKYGVRPDNVEIVKQVPGVQVYEYLDGSIANIAYNEPFSTEVASIGEAINSNVQSGSLSAANSFKTPVPVNASVVQETGEYAMSSGSTVASSGSTLSTVVAKIGPAVAAVTVGARLGKYVSKALYSADPDYWDRHLPTMNPATWSSIIFTGDDPFREKFIGALLGINPDDSSTMYMDEDACAYMAYAMKQLEMFSKGLLNVDYSNLSETTQNEITNYGNLKDVHPCVPSDLKVIDGQRTATFSVSDNTEPVYCIWIETTWNKNVTPYFVSKAPFKVNYNIWDSVSQSTARAFYNSYLGYTTYDLSDKYFSYKGKVFLPSSSYFKSPVSGVYHLDIVNAYLCGGTVSGEGSVPGVSDQPGYVAPDTSTWSDPASTKESLKQQRPDLWNGAIYNDVPQPDGTIKRKTYIQVPTIKNRVKNNPTPTNEDITKDDIKVRIKPNPTPSDKEQQDTVVDLITDTDKDNPNPPDVENPPDTGGGDTPPITMPTGQASALWSVYNPSQAQLDSFGSWLWSSDFFSQLKKLFNDPMQAIIGVHKVFANPQISGQSTIKCGYIDSQVPSNVVGSQYTTVDCGTVALREYFGNVFDYSPYTEVKLFLPFIGVMPLDVAYIMRGSISVKYHVDVITGACLAEVAIRRDSAGGVIYTFGGSCIVQYPVSSGSYMSVISGVLGTVASGVMAGVSIGTGNPIGAVYGISGAAQSILNTHTNVQHSGGFTGCAGAMGGKKPYLIISRPQTELNGHEPHMSGLPSNDYITLSDRSGFVKCKHVHVAGIDNATANEKDEIERLLKQGVMI